MDFVSKINKVVMLCLLLASLYLGFGAVVSANEVVTSLDESMSFGMAVELNIAMCLSWMPVISDYTRTLKKSIYRYIELCSGILFWQYFNVYNWLR